MKKLVQVAEVEGEGFIGLMGKKVLVMCANYFYAGELVGVNDTCIKLTKAGIVYETGEWSQKDFADIQMLPHDVYIQLGAVESFMETNK